MILIRAKFFLPGGDGRVGGVHSNSVKEAHVRGENVEKKSKSYSVKGALHSS